MLIFLAIIINSENMKMELFNSQKTKQNAAFCLADNNSAIYTKTSITMQMRMFSR